MDVVSRNGGGGVGERDGEAEGRFRVLVERAPAVLYVDASREVGGSVYMSPRAEGMLGYRPEEWLVDKGFWGKILHPEDRERVLGAAARARETGEPFEGEYRLVRSDGRVVWVRDEAVPVPDGEGCPGCWQGVLVDVTERRETEEACRRSEERFRLVARATGEAIWDNDLTTGTQEWAGATEALFGYPPHRGRTGRWWEDRVHPEDRGRVLAGLECVLAGDGETWAEAYRFRRADGSYAEVADRGHVVRGEGGRPVRMVGSMADVTEKKRHERALEESEERFRTTFEAAAVGMAHVAPDGRWLRVNGKLCEISGYPRGELLRMSYLDLAPPEDLEASRERVRRLLAGETGPYSVERRFVRKDGSYAWVSLSVSLAPRPLEEPAYLICVAEDITERKLRGLILGSLTTREREVLALMERDCSNAEVAGRLNLSLCTVKTHVRHVLGKLGVKNRRELLRCHPSHP